MPEANSTGVGVMCWCNHSHPLPTLTPPPQQASTLYIVESGWVWKRGAYGVISNPRELF